MATNPFFNTEYYLQNNRDVFVSGMNAETHYAQYGAAEALEGAAGRKPAPWFDIVFYFENNPDLINAGLTAPELFQHFTTYGYKEGRAPNAAAEQNVNADSLLAYALANPDLLEAFGIEADATELTDAQFADLSFQYFAYGYNEDRPALPSDQVTDVDAPGPTLTVGKDYIEVEGDNNTISAPVEQNLLGAVTNTLETGDVILGAEGSTGNKLEADLAISISGTQTVAPAISATTKNIDVVELRAQTGNDDWANSAQGNFSHIDAEKFEGVKEWWSTNSRATIQIEDVRTAPEDTTIGLKNSDPFVGFNVYFDPQQLSADTVASNSNLTLTLVDNQNPGSLADVPVDGFTFTLGGESYTLQSDAMGAATNYAEFEEALQAALAETEGLEGVTAKLNADNTITLNDPAGQAFTAGSWKFINDEVPAAGTVSWNQVVGAPDIADELISTNVVLDNVGRTSQGGTVDIGSLGDGGVQQFDVNVQSDSWVRSLESNSYLGNDYGDAFLEVVNVNGEQANLTIGTGFVQNAAGEVVKLESTDGRVLDGLTNVRELNAEDYAGNIKAGIVLDGDVFARYLDDAEEPVEFSYVTGAGKDNLTLDISGGVSSDPDFKLNVDLGANDDRLNLTTDGNLNSITVDGGEGYNTIELNADQGTNAATTFAGFSDFQKYVVAGDTNTTHVFGDTSGVNGVESVVVATGQIADLSDPLNPIPAVPGGDTTLSSLEADTTVTISGKNQTLGNSSNSAQNFGTITVNNAAAAALAVKLDNTARLDEMLTVGGLVITGDNTRTLDLESAGKRATENTVTQIDAELVNTFNITGTQNLTTNIVSAANFAATKNADVGNFVVDASELDARAVITVNADIVSRVDSVVGVTNSLIGAAGATDQLTLLGASVTSDLTVTKDGTKEISGFETLNFNQLNEVTFDAINVKDAGTYNLSNITGISKFTNLADNLNVNINTANVNNTETNALIKDGVTLTGEGAAINVNLTGTTAWAVGSTSNLNIGGYSTVNLAVDSGAYDFNLNAVDSAGLVQGVVGYQAVGTTVAGRELVLTGGTGLVGDTIKLENLDNNLRTVDISGYAGVVTGSMADTALGDNVTNVEVVVGAWNMNWDVKADYDLVTTPDGSNADASDIVYNTTFRFTDANSASTSTWQIENFIFAGEGTVGTTTDVLTGASFNNYTKLDVSDLGIRNFTELTVVDDGADTIVVARNEFIDNGGNIASTDYSWKIEIAGVNLEGNSGFDLNFDYVV